MNWATIFFSCYFFCFFFQSRNISHINQMNRCILHFRRNLMKMHGQPSQKSILQNCKWAKNDSSGRNISWQFLSLSLRLHHDNLYLQICAIAVVFQTIFWKSQWLIDINNNEMIHVTSKAFCFIYFHSSLSRHNDTFDSHF